MGFAKADDEWCLAVKPMQFASGFEGHEMRRIRTKTRLVRPASPGASRAIRIETLKHLPQLVELMTERAQDRIATILAAKAFAK
jgi:hypothetical protein